MRLLFWLLIGLSLMSSPVVGGPSDACLVCGGPPGSATREVVVHGRTVPLCDHSGCEDDVRRDPERHLAQLGARAALFSDEMDFHPRPSWTAFALGVAALAGVLALAAVAHRRLPATGLTRIPSTLAPVACPACGDQGHPAASACARCRAALTPSAASEVDRA
jgi:hypothetical protein